MCALEGKIPYQSLIRDYCQLFVQFQDRDQSIWSKWINFVSLNSCMVVACAPKVCESLASLQQVSIASVFSHLTAFAHNNSSVLSTKNNGRTSCEPHLNVLVPVYDHQVRVMAGRFPAPESRRTRQTCTPNPKRNKYPKDSSNARRSATWGWQLSSAQKLTRAWKGQWNALRRQKQLLTLQNNKRFALNFIQHTHRRLV